MNGNSHEGLRLISVLVDRNAFTSKEHGIKLGEVTTTLMTCDLRKQTKLYTETRSVMVINIRKAVWDQVIKNLIGRNKNSCFMLDTLGSDILVWKLGKKFFLKNKETFQRALLKLLCSPRDTGE